MEDLPPAGSGNGGRTCFSCSCLLLLMTGLLTAIMFLPPLFSPFTFADTYALPSGARWSTPSCLSACCCLGVAMFLLSMWLILIDDPSKSK